MLDLNKLKNIHFIGIGGIGISGLAKIFLWEGKKISGSDLISSKNILDLKKLGAKIFIGPHKSKNITKNIDLIIYTQAVEKNNPEIKVAKKLNTKILSYPQALGLLTHDKFSICISGTHGKTTTTALSSLVLTKAKFNPTCIIGSNLKKFDGNARFGAGKYLVLEADEYRSSFLNYWPKIIILTTIEYEHPDYFKNLNHALEIYKKYVKRLPRDGVLIANADDKNVMKVVRIAKCRILTYGTKIADFAASDIKLERGYPKFNLKSKILNSKSFELKIPGLHNVYNALAVIALAQELKIDLDIVQKVLANYHDAWRRFEIKKVIKNKNITIIDDYAHHPTEIKVTLRAARERFPKRKIICIFQPHQIKRIKILFNDFTCAFFDADEVIITDIYVVAGRDAGDRKIYSKCLTDALKKKKVNVKYIAEFNKIAGYIKKTVSKNCVVITMGAGDITKLSDRLAREY